MGGGKIGGTVQMCCIGGSSGLEGEGDIPSATLSMEN